MSTGTQSLTSHQRRTLGIIEDGGARGVAMESIVREEQAENRLKSDIIGTVYSLRRRGLVTIETTRTLTLGEYGPYYAEHRQVHLTR